MTKDQLIAKRIYWPKIAMFVLAIVLPQLAVGWSNLEVFPDAILIATIIIVVIIGISGISTYFSGNADPATRKYAMWHDFTVAFLTCIVLLFHFQVAREVSAGNDQRKNIAEKEKTGQEYADREADRKLALQKSEAEYLKEQRRLMLQLPPSQRRLLNAPSQVTPTPFTTAKAAVEDRHQTTIKTPEEVRASWFKWLFWASAFEIIVAVLGGMILMMVWQWDVDGDGINDALQTNGRAPIGFTGASKFSALPATGQTTTIQQGGSPPPPPINPNF